MLKENKNLVIGTVAATVAWLCVYYFLVQGNWAAAAQSREQAEVRRKDWLKNFDNGIPRLEAEEKLAKSNIALKDSFNDLKKMEFGSYENLKAFTVEAAGTDDPKNYLDTKRKEVIKRAGEGTAVSLKDVDILESEASETGGEVAVDLVHAIMVDRFVTACKDSGVPVIKRVTHRAPALIHRSDENQDSDSDENKDKDKDKDSKKKKSTTAAIGDRLVQFPMRVTCAAPERAFARLMYELQKKSDDTHSFFCIRGFQVTVRDTSSGMVDATLVLNALLNEKTVHQMKMPLHNTGEEEQRPARDFDPRQY